MDEYVIERDSLPEAYHKALEALHHFGDICDCEDWGCKQKEVSMTMIIRNPMQEPMISKLWIGGPRELEQYRMEMIDGILDFEIEKGNWNYTYHDRIKDQIPFVIEELKRNPSSRRAVINVRTPEDIGSPDPACMQHIQFFIRNGKLYTKTLFRSNDAVKATFMNVFALIFLAGKIAKNLGVELGTFTHRANSFHCYEKDFKLLEGYVNVLHKNPDDTTYFYEDFFKELMDDYHDEILEQVEQLKHTN